MTFTPAETLPCTRCELEMEFETLETSTRLYVYVCKCGTERRLSHAELVFVTIRTGLGFGGTR